ncbi:hypothetical protein FQN54_009119 [Arachnomyces sp. PD_36]|nr:hypothetical protein FQN54_009119 [Arachnomyces sp. PD_36]
MSRIGYVFNKVLQKNIPVVLVESGEGYKRLTGVIGEEIKQAALAKIRGPFENGDLFKDDDLRSMEQLAITNMSHSSPGDASDHYSVQGESANGSKIKSGHVPQDASKQTVSLLPPPPLAGMNI